MTADLRDQYPPLLDVRHVQKIASLSKNTAYSLLKSGEIPSVRIGGRFKVPRDKFLRQVGLLPDSESQEGEA